MFRKTFPLFYFLLVFTPVLAGNGIAPARTGIGISAGVANYIGDLDDNFVPRFSTPGFGVHVIQSFGYRVSLRLSYMHGWIHADDKDGLITGMQGRNLNFHSRLDEGSAVLRVKAWHRSRKADWYQVFDPYIFGGVAFFHFDPHTTYNGVDYDLHALGTEGQYLTYGKNPAPYSLYQWAVPMGFGIEKSITVHWDVGLEIGFRKLFTDYLDDVSWNYPDQTLMKEQMGADAAYLSDPSLPSKYPDGRAGYSRGNPEFNDWYSYTNFHVTYYFLTLSGGHRVTNYTKCLTLK